MQALGTRSRLRCSLDKVTICFTHFKSLTLANLAAALYSVRRQDFSRVQELIVFDNDSHEHINDIRQTVDDLSFPVPVSVHSDKHGVATRKQSWSTNATVRLASAPWVFYTRSDYLLAFDMVRRFTDIVEGKPTDWNGFVVSNGVFLGDGIEAIERTGWRQDGPVILRGVEYDYTVVDSGVWMARRSAFDAVGGFPEDLPAWGHAQTLWEWKMFQSGVEFVRIPTVLFWHPGHGAERDIDLAHKELKELGGYDLKKMWARYHGVSPYAGLP